MLTRFNLHSESGQNGIRVLANDAGIATHTSLVSSFSDLSTDNNNLGAVSRDGFGESRVRGNSSGCTTSTTGRASILASIAGGGLSFISARLFFSILGMGLSRLKYILTSSMLARLTKLLVDVGTPRAIPDRQPVSTAAINFEGAIFEN